MYTVEWHIENEGEYLRGEGDVPVPKSSSVKLQCLCISYFGVIMIKDNDHHGQDAQWEAAVMTAATGSWAITSPVATMKHREKIGIWAWLYTLQVGTQWNTSYNKAEPFITSAIPSRDQVFRIHLGYHCQVLLTLLNHNSSIYFSRCLLQVVDSLDLSLSHRESLARWDFTLHAPLPVLQ